MKLTIKNIIAILNFHNVDYTILRHNETAGIHVDVFGDGTRWDFVDFKNLNTVNKLKNFLEEELA